MSELEELFGEDGGQPQARKRLGWTLLIVGVVTSFFGLLCSVVPGAGLVLLAWLVAETDMDRLESGYLPENLREQVRALQLATHTGVVAAIVMLAIQCLLLCSGAYGAILRSYWPGLLPS